MRPSAKKASPSLFFLLARYSDGDGRQGDAGCHGWWPCRERKVYCHIWRWTVRMLAESVRGRAVTRVSQNLSPRCRVTLPARCSSSQARSIGPLSTSDERSSSLSRKLSFSHSDSTRGLSGRWGVRGPTSSTELLSSDSCSPSVCFREQLPQPSWTARFLPRS